LASRIRLTLEGREPDGFVFLQELREVAKVAAVVFGGVKLGDLILEWVRQGVLWLFSPVAVGQCLSASFFPRIFSSAGSPAER